MITCVYSLQRGPVQLALQQLRGAAQPAERVADLVRELADHSPARAALADQVFLAVELARLRHVQQFQQHHRPVGRAERRRPADHRQLLVLLVPRGDLQFLTEGLAGLETACRQRRDRGEPGTQRCQRAPAGLPGARAQQQFGGRVQILQAQRRIRDQHGGGELIEDLAGN